MAEHAPDPLASDPLLQHPDLGPVIAQLAQDHHMIEHLIGGLRRAGEQGITTEEKLRHLDGIEAVVETHFRYEERRLLSVLDDLRDDAVSTTDLFGPLACEEERDDVGGLVGGVPAARGMWRATNASCSGVAQPVMVRPDSGMSNGAPDPSGGRNVQPVGSCADGRSPEGFEPTGT